MAKLVKSASNYVLRRKIQNTTLGSIYERDWMTVSEMDWYANGLSPVWQSGNFKMTINPDSPARKRYSYGNWEKKEDVWDKVGEELGELRAELSDGTRESQEAELGDFLFSVVNAARLYHLNPDSALEHTNVKFKRRFTYLELRARELGRDLADMSLEEMDALWDEAKAKERENQ